jgi:Protein of unknown function (DUF3071)
VAMSARKAPVRRGPDGSRVSLGEVVTERLEARGVGPDALDWDAWRREDGRWAIRLGYLAGSKQSVAHWVYDTSARQVACEDDEARWLTEDRPPPSPEPARPIVPRLVSVAATGGDEPASGPRSEPAAPRVEPAGPALPAAGAGAAAAVAGSSPGQPTSKGADRAAPHSERLPAAVRFAAPRSERLTGSTDPQALKDGVRPGKRATVPSWDEIVFGRRQD